jgi:hypothetical protein
MRIGSVALAIVACGPSAGTGADGAGSGSASDGAGSSTSAAATDAADTSGASVTTSTADDEGTGGAPGLCLSTVTIVLDTTNGYVGFADVDGDDRPELWRRTDLGRPGDGANVMLLDAFLVEGDGTATAVGTNQIEGSFVLYADVDGDGSDDLLTRPDFGRAQNWHRGQADLTFALPQPIFLTDDFFESWLDVDGDGDADVFASHDFEAGVTLYIGDGTGEFASSGTLQFPIGAWISPVVPTPEPGVFIANNYNGADSLGAASSLWRIELDRGAAPTAVASTPELPHEFLVEANDFDGDGVTDLLTMHVLEPGAELNLWTAAGDGYVERNLAIDVAVEQVAVGDLLGDGGLQLLFTDLAGDLWLLPTPIAAGDDPIAVEGTLTGVDRVLDLGGDGQEEVVSIAFDDDGSTEYAMHNVEPCG